MTDCQSNFKCLAPFSKRQVYSKHLNYDDNVVLYFYLKIENSFIWSIFYKAIRGFAQHRQQLKLLKLYLVCTKELTFWVMCVMLSLFSEELVLLDYILGTTLLSSHRPLYRIKGCSQMWHLEDFYHVVFE